MCVFVWKLEGRGVQMQSGFRFMFTSVLSLLARLLVSGGARLGSSSGLPSDPLTQAVGLLNIYM